jgi:thiol-disulfide isomerase/thioredoxin
MFTSDDLKGKVAIVDFWATWCAPCIEEIPNYNEISAKYADKGVVLVGVTLESGSLEEVKPKVSEFNMKYPVIMGDDKLVEGFGGVLGFPTTFVLTQDGKIYQKYLGLRTNKRELLEKDIEALLAQPGAEVSAVESPSHPM